MEKAIVITPAIGKNLKELELCIKSVGSQTIQTRHLIVVDGYQYCKSAMNEMIITNPENKYVDIAVAPYNTGSSGFYGHRIMAAFAHLHDNQYTLYLDEDNWFEPNHVETLIKTIEANHYKFSYSFRNIYTKEGDFVCQDKVESLGLVESIGGYHLADTSSYCFETEFLIKVSQLWHKGWGADREFFKSMMSMQSLKGKFGPSNNFSLNYRLGGNTHSVKQDFFKQQSKI